MAGDAEDGGMDGVGLGTAGDGAEDGRWSCQEIHVDSLAELGREV